jgi:hypothetical protein
MNKKIYFKTKDDIAYNKRIIDYLVSIGGDNDWGYVGNASKDIFIFMREENDKIRYSNCGYDISTYELKDIDTIESKASYIDNTKECFIRILDKINKNNSL